MPSVPYNPVPRAGASFQAAPSVGLSVPAEAFGAAQARAGQTVASGMEAIGRSVSGLGNTMNQIGDQLGARAIEFQNLQNDTWAREKDVQVMIDIGNAQSEFDRLEGQNQVDALPGHMERIKQIRQEALESAPNPMAKKMLDSQIARRVGFAIVDSGHKAGTSAKAANKHAGGARIDAATATADPAQAGSMEMATQTIINEVERQGREAGELPETIENNKRKALNKMWLSSITKSAMNKPEQAEAIYEKYKDKMDPDVREAALHAVNQGMANTQARNDADEIARRRGFDPAKGPGQLEPMLELAKKYAEKYGQNNPQYGDALERRVRSNYEVAMSGYRDTQRGHMNTLGNFIIGQNDAKRVVSEDGVLGPNAPQPIKDAFKALEPSSKKTVLNWIAKMAKGETIQWTPESMKKWNEFRGMASDRERVGEFVDMGPGPIFDANLPYAAQRELLNLQRTATSRAQNVQLNQAMSQLEPMLRAAGIWDNKEARAQFRGALEDQLRDEQGKTRTKINPEEVRKIGSNLLQKQGGFLGMFQTPMFQSSVPSEIKDQIRKELEDKGYTVTDEEVQRQYAYQLYKRLYTEKTKPAAAKGDKKLEGAPPELEGLGQ